MFCEIVLGGCSNHCHPITYTLTFLSRVPWYLPLSRVDTFPIPACHLSARLVLVLLLLKSRSPQPPAVILSPHDPILSILRQDLRNQTEAYLTSANCASLHCSRAFRLQHLRTRLLVSPNYFPLVVLDLSGTLCSTRNKRPSTVHVNIRAPISNQSTILL